MEKDLGKTVPLAFDENGDPTPIPPEAQYFRLKVRRGTARKPRLVRTESGAPFLLPLETRPEDLQQKMGPGIYRLELVNKDGFGLAVPHFSYVIERENSDEDEDPNASRAEAFVSKILKEQRQLVNRILDMVEQQSTERAAEADRRAAEQTKQSAEQSKRSSEHARLLTTQVERYERSITAMADQNAKLVTAIANKFGDYISEATNLLSAHPAAGGKPSAADIVSEHKQIRNAVADLAEKAQEDVDGDSNPLLSILDKSLDTALPVLGPALQRVVHRLFGLSQQQSNELAGVPRPALSQGSAATAAKSNGSQPSPAALARVMDVLNHLTVPERAAAMEIQKAMNADDRNRLRTELLALTTVEAVARVRQILAVRAGQGSGTSQTHLRAVLAHLTNDERDATQELLDALSGEARTRWRIQILLRSAEDAATLIREQLAELAAAIPAPVKTPKPSEKSLTKDEPTREGKAKR